MLFEEDKARIRAEEVFRHEIQRELSAAPSRRGLAALWKLANNPLGIWFLATVVVGAFSYTFDTVRQGRALDRTEARLNLEIASRLTNAWIFYMPDSYLVSHFAGFPDGDVPPEFLKDFHGAFEAFHRALDSGTTCGAFAEYRNQNLPALIWELGTLRRDTLALELKPTLDAALDVKIKRIFWNNKNMFADSTSPLARKRIPQEIQKMKQNFKALYAARWSLGYDFGLEDFDPNLSQPDLGNYKGCLG